MKGLDERRRFKVIINWQGENHEFYTCSKGEKEALKNVIRKLAKKVGYTTKFVRDYVMSPEARRWEVSK